MPRTADHLVRDHVLGFLVIVACLAIAVVLVFALAGAGIWQ
jgi:hypothetical protein